jgi:hypothetical protein
MSQQLDSSDVQVVEPAALETKMLEKEVAASSTPAAIGNPEDLAAAFFKQNYPRVKRLLGTLSRRGVERAVMCAAAYPLVPAGYKWQSEEERELAWALEQMIACKALMIESTKLNKLNSVEELEKLNKQSLTKGENTNGPTTDQIETK